MVQLEVIGRQEIERIARKSAQFKFKMVNDDIEKIWSRLLDMELMMKDLIVQEDVE